MSTFKKIATDYDSAMEASAKNYRRHENGCITCRQARERARSAEHRCPVGQDLWARVMRLL